MKITALFATALMAHAMLATGAYAQAASTNAPAAVRGDSFMRGMKNPSELAALIEANLKIDSTGRSLLSPEKCHQATEKSCGSAWAYLMMFQIADPKSKALGLLERVDQLPAYLRSLVSDQVSSDEEWFMACMAPEGGDVFSPVSQCMSRPFRKGELAWKSPTGIDVMAGDCTNPLFGKNVPIVVTADCIKVSYTPPFGTADGYTTTTVRYDVYGPHALTGKCLHVEQSGVGKTDLADNCPSHTCSFDATEAFIIRRDHAVVNWHKIGSYVPVQAGTDAIYLPADAKDGFTVSICIDVRGPDGQIHHLQVKNKFFHPTDRAKPGGRMDEYPMLPFDLPTE